MNKEIFRMQMLAGIITESEYNDMFYHHHNEMADLKKQAEEELNSAQEELILLRKEWKKNPTDQARFAYQDAISRVNKAIKNMWKYEK